ncbi:NAD(P)-dependent oxidoreductase, partial [Planktomarina temperata]|nr:NAD(P)-dependent oxidoreductase [Planktomarina temperata]
GTSSVQIWNDARELAGQLEKLDNPVLLNLAGHFISSHSPENISALVSGNLQFPIEIFEALSLSGHSRIVNIGTSWEYSDDGKKEPANLYASLKASNAEHLKWYAQNFPLRAINLKLNDTFGGSDNRKKLLPYLKQSWRDGEPAELRSSSQLINLLHINDVMGGILHAAEQTLSLDSHEELTAFLLGNYTVSIGEVIDTINQKIIPDLNVRFVENPQSKSVQRGVWESAPRLTGWTPQLTLQHGLKIYFMDENENCI